MDSAVFQRARDKLVREVERSVRDCVPEHPAREFFLWSFSAHNPERDRWLHLIGISQTVQLTLKLLAGLLDGADHEALLDYLLPMSVYQFYEIVSDNLCIGLSSPLPNDSTRPLRRELVLGFNRAMVQRLRGDSRPAAELLAPLRDCARGVSLLHNTLNADQYHKVAGHYLAQRPAASLADIDGAVWPLLVANIETCQQLAAAVAPYACGEMIAQGLIHRYRGVSALISEPDLLLSRRLTASTDAILVVPTLAYAICGLKEVVQPDAALPQSLRGGVLGEALFTAALLVRLLNDLGTPLLSDAATRRQLLEGLRLLSAGEAGAAPLGDLVRQQCRRYDAALTRLNKDLVHGECNLGLFGLTEAPATQALGTLGGRLEQLARLYAQSKQYLAELAAEVTSRLGDPRPMQLVQRFVGFHEQLYARAYTETGGEYSG